MTTSPKAFLSIDRDGWTQEIQVSIDDDSSGYRIFGPKYNGSSTSLERIELTRQDANEIRGYLDDAFPPNNKG